MRSTAVSTKKGTAHNMLKESAKRRRSKKQIEKDKADAEQKEREIQIRLSQADEILAGREDQEAYIEELKQKAMNQNIYEAAVERLKKNSLIKQTGDTDFLIVDDFD